MCRSWCTKASKNGPSGSHAWDWRQSFPWGTWCGAIRFYVFSCSLIGGLIATCGNQGELSSSLWGMWCDLATGREHFNPTWTTRPITAELSVCFLAVHISTCAAKNHVICTCSSTCCSVIRFYGLTFWIFQEYMIEPHGKLPCPYLFCILHKSMNLIIFIQCAHDFYSILIC